MCRFMKRLFLIGFLALVYSLMPSVILGQTKSRKVKSLERQRSELLKKIKEIDKKLQQAKADTKGKEQRIELIDRQIGQREAVIFLLGDQVKAMEEEIDSLGRHISYLESKELALKDKYKSSVKALAQKGDEVNLLLFIFSSESLQQSFDRQRFLSQYADAIGKTVEGIRLTRKEISASRSELNLRLKEKSDLYVERNKEKDRLEKEKDQRQKELSLLKATQLKLSKSLAQQQEEARLLDRKIEELIAREIAEAERKAKREAERRLAARRRKQQTREVKKGKSPSKNNAKAPEQKEEEPEEATAPERKAETAGGYAMDAVERRLSGSFSQNKGRLPMPVRGSYSIVASFGVQMHSEYSRVRTSNSGIDIAPKKDFSCYAVFDGVVSRVFVTPSYHTSIIIRHGNYLTVYSNLSNVTVRSGERVKLGQVLGTIAEGNDTHQKVLHFQLWYERNKQNPSSWLKK